MPPLRAATTTRRRDEGVVVKHPAARGRSFQGAMVEEHAGEAYSEADEVDWGDGVKRAKKVARPRVLARGKHKVERL